MKRVYGFSKTETGIVINIPNVKINDQRFDEMMEVLGDKYPFLRIWRNRKGNVAMSGFIPHAHAMKYVLGIEIGYSTDNLIGSYFQFHTEYKKAVALTKRDELDKVIDYYSFGAELDYADRQIESLQKVTADTIEAERNLCDNPANDSDDLPF